MKSIKILFLVILIIPYCALAEEEQQQIRKKSEWYAYLDERLNGLENKLSSDLEMVSQQQKILNEEMYRLNNKLENRFDKYFLWGYGTLLVVISTLTSVIFNKRKGEKKSQSVEEDA